MAPMPLETYKQALRSGPRHKPDNEEQKNAALVRRSSLRPVLE